MKAKWDVMTDSNHEKGQVVLERDEEISPDQVQAMRLLLLQPAISRRIESFWKMGGFPSEANGRELLALLDHPFFRLSPQGEILPDAEELTQGYLRVLLYEQVLDEAIFKGLTLGVLDWELLEEIGLVKTMLLKNLPSEMRCADEIFYDLMQADSAENISAQKDPQKHSRSASTENVAFLEKGGYLLKEPSWLLKSFHVVSVA